MSFDLLIVTIPGREKYLKQSLKSIKNSGIVPKVVKSSDTNTPSDGRIEVIRNLTGKYFTWVNDDDVLIPKAVEKCIDLLEKDNSISGVSTISDKIDEVGKIIVPRFNEGKYDPKLHAIHPTHVHELTVFRRELLLDHLDTAFSFKIMHHWYLSGMMLQYGDWIKLQEVGYQWRIHPGNSHKVNSDFREYNEVQLLVQNSVLRITT